MARIRSVYPVILTDPDFALLPFECRLFFIYLWIIADDAGNLERNPLGLKMACFPGDEWATVAKIAEMVDALISGRFLIPYESDGRQYLRVRNFSKYQKPDHPTAPRYPLFPGQEFTYHVRQGNTWVPKTVKSTPPNRSTNVPRTLPERIANVLAGEELDLERKGKELGEEGTEPADAPSPLFDRGGGAASHPSAMPSFIQRDKGNGGEEGAIQSGFLAFVEGLSLMKRDALRYALDLYSGGKTEMAMEHLKAAMFKGLEFDRAAEFIRSERDQ